MMLSKDSEVFTSLSLLCVNVKKTFLLTFWRVGDSVGVSSKVLLGEKPISYKLNHCGTLTSILIQIYHGTIIATLFALFALPKLHVELASSED